MERKKRLLAYIRSDGYVPLKAEELKMVLDVPDSDTDKFYAMLRSLCAEGRIYLSKRGRYAAGRNNVIVGRLSCSAKGGFGFVCSEDEDVPDLFIHESCMGGALNGDRVSAVYDGGRTNGDAPTGRIRAVLDRANKIIIGVVGDIEGGYYTLIADDRAIYGYPHIAPKDIGDAQIGDRVSAEIISVDNERNIYVRVAKKLGAENSIKGIISGKILLSGVKTEFDEETLAEAAGFTREPADEEMAGRLDLRGEKIFTIDGETARDFDDAVSAEPLENGAVRIGVHIADVSYYVKEDGACDAEARRRGTSIYLADRVIPMLPERLSNGTCSLRPNKDRLTLSVFMDINENGEITSHTIHKSVIRSCARLTYEDMNKLLEKDDAELKERYADIYPVLTLMLETAKKLKARRRERGAVEFDFPEAKIYTSRTGRPTNIVCDERGAANKLIEEFMLAANETVAEMAFWAELPFVYRVHEAPSEEKLEAFSKFIRNFGLTLKGKTDKDNPVKPKAFEQILERVRGTAEERLISKTMLRSLMKAEYSPVCGGHFGLAAPYYCHFTSPIRRYPDLAAHRILKLYIDGKLDDAKKAELNGFVKEASVVSTEREIGAEILERTVDDVMKACYMQQYIGESFKAVISAVMEFGIFVELPNTVEGLIRTENMTGDFYEYNEEDMSLTGRQSGQKYRIGDEAEVTVAKADPVSGKVDFILTKDLSFELWRRASAVRPPYKKQDKKKKNKKNGIRNNKNGRNRRK